MAIGTDETAGGASFNFLNGCLTCRTGFSGLVGDSKLVGTVATFSPVEVLFVGETSQVDTGLEIRSYSFVEGLDLVLCERGDSSFRMDLCLVEDVLDVDVSDSCDVVLVD